MRDKAVEFFLKGMMVFCAAMIVFCFFGMFMSIKQSSHFREDCLARGGVPFMPKHDWICLKKEMVQP